MTKVALFDKTLQKTASYYKALGHPARLAILRYLAEINVCISGDISNELPLSRSTVNQHLKELKNAGFIKGEIEGVRMNYCLDCEKIKDIKNVMIDFVEKITTDTQNDFK